MCISCKVELKSEYSQKGINQDTPKGHLKVTIIYERIVTPFCANPGFVSFR